MEKEESSVEQDTGDKPSVSTGAPKKKYGKKCKVREVHSGWSS